MAQSQLEIILGLQDKASGPLGRLRSALGGIATIAGGIIGAQLITKIGTGLIELGRGSIQAASDLNEAMNATSVVFGDAAARVQEFGATAADTTGLTAAAFNQLASQTGAMLQNFGLAQDDAADQTINLAQRAADMASIFNTDVSDAMTAINAALRGEADPIERFGVSMSAAAVQAKALELGYTKTNGVFEQGALTQARLALLYEQTDKIAGDFVNTSDQLANAQRINQARWENFQANIGAKFLPLMTTFQGVLLAIGEKVFPIISDALDKFQPVIDGVANAIDRFFGFLGEGQDPVASLVRLVYDIGQAFGLSEKDAGNLAGKFYDFIQAVQDGWESLKEFAGLIWSQLGPGLAQLGEWIGDIVAFIADHWEQLKPIFLVVGGIIGAVLIALNAPIVAIIAAIVLLSTAWANNWGGIQEKVGAVWAWLQPILQNIWEWLQTNIPLALETLSAFWTNTLLPAIQDVWAWIQGTLIPLLLDLWAWLQVNIPIALQALADFWQSTLLPAIQTVGNWITGTLIPALSNLWDWLSVQLTAAIETLSGFWNNNLLPAITAIWDFITTSVIPLFQSLWDLLQVAGELAITALQGFWQNILLPALTDIWTFISENILPIFNDLWDFLKDTFGPFLDTFGSGTLSVFQSAWDGIKGAVGFVIDKINALKDLLSKITLPDWLQTNSPTPFEQGLRGIGDALADLAQAKLPQFSAALTLTGANNPLGGFSTVPITAGSGGMTQNITQNFYDEGAAALGMAIVTTQGRNRLRGRLGL